MMVEMRQMRYRRSGMVCCFKAASRDEWQRVLRGRSTSRPVIDADTCRRICSGRDRLRHQQHRSPRHPSRRDDEKGDRQRLHIQPRDAFLRCAANRRPRGGQGLGHSAFQLRDASQRVGIWQGLLRVCEAALHNGSIRQPNKMTNANDVAVMSELGWTRPCTFRE